MKLPRVVTYLGAFAFVVLAIVGFGAWLLPRLIDTQLIKDKISSELAKNNQGNLGFGKIAVLWLPRPSVAIENVEIAIGDQTRVTIRLAKIFPSMVYLLTGRWVARQALLQQAQFRIRLPQRAPRPFNLAELENEIRAALVVLTSQLPAPLIDLTDGSAEVRIGDQPPLILESVEAQTVGSSATLGFELRARSNLWERLKIVGRASPEDLALQLDVRVERLKIKESLALLALPIMDYLQPGEATLTVKVVAVGFGNVKTSIDGAIGPLVLARHGGRSTVEAKRLKGRIIYEGGALQAELEQLDLVAPRLQASGSLKILADSCVANVKVRDGEIAQLGALALRIADDTEGVRGMLRYLPAGTISEMNFHSAGRSCADLIGRKNIVVAATLRDGKIAMPDPDLEFTNVAAAIRIADDILEAKNITAKLGTAKGWDGELRLGLTDKTAPFHLDIQVHTGAPELQSVLLKLIVNETFRRELLNVQRLDGELTGRLILGETLDSISPTLAVAKANLRATYAPVPFPINIRGARFNFDPSIIQLENAEGSVGASSFAALGATWHHDGSRQFKISAGRVSLDLQQTDTLLRRFKELRPYFTNLQSMNGQLQLQNLTLAGVYDEPAAWAWASTGSFNQVEIQRAEFPERITLSRGQLTADQGRIIFSGTAASLSDASFVADGIFEHKQGTATQFEAHGKGHIGAQMTHWLSRFAAVPDDVKLRSPLTITAGRVAWRVSGDMSFAGQVIIAAGPQLSIDVVKQPQRLSVQNLTIDDGGRRARLALQLAGERLDLSFSGELTPQTVDNVFASLPMKGASLRGEIEVSATRAAPERFSARGEISGSNLLLPLGSEKIAWEKFTIASNGEAVLVRSAELRWRDSRLSVAGKVGAGKDVLRLDLDVSADRLSLAELDRLFDGTDEQAKKAADAPALARVEGTVRLKLDHFTTECFTLSGLQIRTDLSSSLIKAEIERANVCGINTTGSVEVTGRNIRLALQLAAKDADLEPTTVCLTNQRSDIKGTYTFRARLNGSGDRSQLRSALKGDFNFSARDGAFVRAAGVDAAFDYLNDSGDFNVAFPDLDKQAVAYQALIAKGTFDGEKIFNDELIIQASPFTVTGQGSIDLQRQQVDLKGLVAVALPAQRVIKRIPIFGPIIGGSVVGIPLRISGSVERPKVTYLSPADLGAELLNLPLRILGTPLDAVRLFVPGNEN